LTSVADYVTRLFLSKGVRKFHCREKALTDSYSTWAGQQQGVACPECPIKKDSQTGVFFIQETKASLPIGSDSSDLPKFISYPESPAGIFPLDIILLAPDPAAATLDATLVPYLDLTVGIHAVHTDWAKIQATMTHTSLANVVGFYFQMSLFLINIVFQRHQDIIHKYWRQFLSNMPCILRL
jgi:hypothetical protein